MQLMANLVSWQFNILEIWALLALMTPFTADLALHCHLGGIPLHCAETFRSSLTDAINELVEVRTY